MTVTRRAALGAAAAALSAPRIVRADAVRTLKYMPSADMPSLDPITGGGNTARDHCNTIYDQLFGLDANFEPHPQMLAGVQTETDGKVWDLTLREGLQFHDGTPVLARDCVATIRRWAKRDSYGTSLMERTDELSAVSDRVIRFRLKRPFSLLPEALAQPACVMLPERVAQTDAFKPITEAVGSGPYRFIRDEWVQGSHWFYAKFDKYVPRPDGAVSFLSGPRVAHFDRLVWTYIADHTTKASAMIKGDFDWWQNPSHDLFAQMRKVPNLRLDVIETLGGIGVLRFNHLFPPFNNPAIRRLVLACINQRDCMEAVSGGQPDYFLTGAGLFTPGTPMASKAGTEALTGRTDFEAVKKELAAAGYNGEKVVLIAASTIPAHAAESAVADDLMRRMGLNVDYQTGEFASIVRRRISKEPPDKGGWNATVFDSAALPNALVPANFLIRGGAAAGIGWPDLPRVEELREAWLNAETVDQRKRLAAEIQMQFFRDVPHVPLGEYFGVSVFQKNIVDVQKGWPVMHGVRRV